MEKIFAICVITGLAYLFGALSTIPSKPLRNFRKRVMCPYCKGTGKK